MPDFIDKLSVARVNLEDPFEVIEKIESLVLWLSQENNEKMRQVIRGTISGLTARLRQEFL